MSLAWKFFTVSKEDTNYAICKTCKVKISHGVTTRKAQNTTNLIRHLKHHPVEHAQFEEVSKGKTAKAGQSSEPATGQQPLLSFLGMSSEKTKAITKKIMEFMVLDDQPFSIVEDRNLINFLSPKYTIPSRWYFSDVALPELFNLVSCHTSSRLQAEPETAISFTSDIWTSKISLMSMLSLTATWVDKDFQQQVLLHCQEMTGSHTAANIAATFDTMLQRWGLEKNRIHVVLRDNGRNISKALDEGNLPSLPCMAHTLELVKSEASLMSLMWWKLQGRLSDILNTQPSPIHEFMTFRHSWVSPVKEYSN